MSYVGYSVNISRTGIFIMTIHPAPPNATVLIEFSNLQDAPIVEGIVVHAARVSPTLRSVQRSGMGLKFREPLGRLEELLVIKPGAIAPPPVRFPRALQTTEESESGSGSTSAAEIELPSEAETEAQAESREWVAASSTRKERLEPPIVRREFDSWSSFLESYHQEIANGALFVPTARDLGLDSDVQVEILLPRFSQPVKVLARVVQRLESAGSPNTAGRGIGVTFADAPGLMEWLKPFVDRVEAGR